MNDLINLIHVLVEETEYISKSIDINIELIKKGELEDLENANNSFYKFMNKFIEHNSQFKNKLAELNFTSVWDIKKHEKYNTDEIDLLLKSLNCNFNEAHKKITLYSQLISTELNMINKIKYFKQTGKVDLKF